MIQVIDNICENPDAVRESALKAGFGTWKPRTHEVGSGIYEGMGFWGDHATLLNAVHRNVGLSMYPNSMFFRVTSETTESAYVHSDREVGDVTVIVYLSRHDGSGTGFYKHRETGMDRMPSFNELKTKPEFFSKLKAQMVKGDEKDWELTQFVEGKWNRALVFSAPLFHSRMPKHGFGISPEDGRLVWACHMRLF